MIEPLTVAIPARKGKAVLLNKGQHIKVINTHGQQVIDTWAFKADDLAEFMSMEHSHTSLSKIVPSIGDSLVTNRRRPILTIIEDSSPGIHDTLLAACDRYRYELLGFEDHDNCTDNLIDALAKLNSKPTEIPCPLNLFMNIPVIEGKYIEFRPPVSQAGDYIIFYAEIDCIVAFSCCPMDAVPINGLACQPTEAHYEIF